MKMYLVKVTNEGRFLTFQIMATSKKNAEKRVLNHTTLNNPTIHSIGLV